MYRSSASAERSSRDGGMTPPANGRPVAGSTGPTERLEKSPPRIAALGTAPLRKPTTLADMENYGVLLFIAGLDTVMNGMGLAMRGLALDPELQRKLRAEPKLIAEAAEEMLRRYTFTVPVRIVRKEVELAGAKMKPGE